MHTPQRARRLAAALFIALASLAPAVAAQDPQNDPEAERAFGLYEAQNFVEATPLLEKLAEKYPNEPSVLSRLGFSLYASSASVKDPAKRRQMRDRAREVLKRSQQAGDDSNLTRGTLDALATGDPTGVPFSKVGDAERAIREGEDAFVRGELDKALAAYKRALELDPRLYEAALYAGDMYFKKGHLESDARKKDELMTQAGEWFAKAVRIDADRETAHRYWGNALMMGQNRRDESRAHFVDAIVAEPYNRRAWVGLAQWGQRYDVRLAHPKIDVQQSVTPMKDDKMTITIDPKSLEKSDDGRAAWLLYGLTRAAWTTNDYEKFRKEYPAEKTYRHSLREEAFALRAVVESVRNQQKEGKVRQLSHDLQLLLQLEEAGLLEAYVLFARPDEGIAQDYAEYRKANRDKLRRYLTEYVASGKY
ncbi:MAG TPA: tetratricopeptide repeat protein [Pyrinomonadaceae bacterium]|nr:tetratricopeptide repeat protein [Pyrinomonadaceae bacterium]